jgi:hypothetical protein
MSSWFRHVAAKKQLKGKTKRVNIILIFTLPPNKAPINDSPGNNANLIKKYELRQLTKAQARKWNMTVKIYDALAAKKGFSRCLAVVRHIFPVAAYKGVAEKL